MASPDVEDITDALMTVFQSQFAAELQNVDQAKATPLNPKPPVAWLFGETPTLPQMPVMIFEGLNAKQKEDHYEWRNQTYHFGIEAYVTADDVQKLNRIIRRYGTAIDNLLRANQNVGGAKNLTNIELNFSGLLTNKNTSGLFRAVSVTFDATVITD